LRSKQESSTVVDSNHERTPNVQTATAYLETLNPEQRRAVEHVAEGGLAAPPLLVIAGAGSGKTNTLAHRVAHLIVQGADPRRILLMTFSRRAASEMTKRVERIARKVLGDNAGIMTDALTWAGTYHGIGARLLREYAEQIGLDPAFTIHDREDSADLMNLVRHEKGLSKTESRFPTKGTCLSIYSRCVNAETPIEQVIGVSYPWCAGWAAELKELFSAYVEAKQKQNVLDYDDLLLYWAQMIGDAGLADDIGGRFDHVLVDEYQDTNRLQSSILLALKPGGRGLTVVGDDAQSIYSFRAATVRNILDFPDQFSPPANIITLDRNYRSTQTILAAANGVIGLAKERFTKNLWTERTSAAKPQLVTVRDETDQARFIVERIQENRESGTLLKEQAVLFRTSSHSGPLEIELNAPEHPVREIRRAEVPRRRPHQGHAGAAAVRRKSARSRRGVPTIASIARHWFRNRAARARPHGGGRRPDCRARGHPDATALRRRLEELRRDRGQSPIFGMARRSGAGSLVV
jgi:DNA helicase-2/ATP-dependent DNA helicase PcrA